jgi:hypothetical protein
LFEDIDWSTDRVFEQTQARVAELEMREMTLPAWYDVDDGFVWSDYSRSFTEKTSFGNGFAGISPYIPNVC